MKIYNKTNIEMINKEDTLLIEDNFIEPFTLPSSRR